MDLLQAFDLGEFCKGIPEGYIRVWSKGEICIPEDGENVDYIDPVLCYIKECSVPMILHINVRWVAMA